MKTLRIFGLLFAVFLAAMEPAASQTQVNNLAATSWIATVEGEAKTRTIAITTVSPKADGVLELQANYSFTGGNVYPVQAQLSQSVSPRQLTLITPADTKIVATERADGSFQGTFTLKDGRVKGIIITRLSGDIQLAAAKPATGTLAGDVPAECAAYVGAWVGRWNQGGFGDMYLRITDVRSVGGEGCMARYSYSSSATTVPGKKTLEIKDGAIAFVCNSSTGGTCVFTRKSDALWASYSNTMGGQNSGTFKRTE